MGKQGQSIQSTFSPKQIEIIKTGIALKYSDSQGASEIINFNKKDTTPSSDHSSTLKPDYKKLKIALKYSDSQGASEIINFNKKDTTPSSDHSSTLKPDYKKLKDVSQNDTGNDYLYRVKDHID